MLRGAGACLVAVSLSALGCGSLQKPTESSEPEHSSAATGDPSIILGAPAKPSPSPSPSPSSDPGSEPAPETGAEGASTCGTPLPPPVTKIDVKIHQRGPNAWILDATPLVGPDPAYCAKIGFTDGRANCAVRPEGNPQRTACELYAVGRAKDTKRAGPTWTLGGQLCRGAASGCENHDENQYLLYTYSSGTFQACAGNGVCGEVLVER
jgi:hypothetical protein